VLIMAAVPDRPLSSRFWHGLHLESPTSGACVMAVATIDEYVAGLPDDVRGRMQTLRALVHRVVPGAEERISYAMPTFAVEGRSVVHLAAWKKHIALYPLPELPGEWAAEAEQWRGAKDALHLPHDRPLPTELLEQVVTALVARAQVG
jgi:uncharacterized protein YdhG (YjbR/CyaY superfamily)